jgi:hypothetical protein
VIKASEYNPEMGYVAGPFFNLLYIKKIENSN